uniref:Uncharacterized protein n=1 Tax=Leersia perrieri TaxID=77586 RepID=A0A0D9WW26_9ORYZ
MAHFGDFGDWSPMDVATAALAMASSRNGSGAAAYVPLPPGMTVATPGDPSTVQIEAARQWREMENTTVRFLNHLVTCAGAIQAGDYAAAAGSLSDAREILTKIPVSVGIRRVATLFADALSERLFPAFPNSVLPLPLPTPRAEQRKLFRGFYEAGPHLKFGHFTANQAILEAFEGCGAVHVIDFAVMDGVQWPALIQALAIRPGGPPFLRLTGIGPLVDSDRDELRDVGIQLAEFARSCNVPFTFRGIAANQIDCLRPWMFRIVPGETIAVNAMLHLHRLLVDQDATMVASSPAPIEAVLHLIASLDPKVFTVVEQEANHNKSSLQERITNSLFYYAAMFDSVEVSNRDTGGDGAGNPLAEAFLQREIADIVCHEGISRVERHEPMARWMESMQRAGLTLIPHGQKELYQAAMHVRELSGAGFGVQENDGFLTLTWRNQKLYTASAWHRAVTGPRVVNGGATAMDPEEWKNGGKDGNNGGSFCWKRVVKTRGD